MLDYGVIGNCKTAALVKSDGAIEWMCYPDFDSPSVFAKILDRKKGGSFEIVPDRECSISQSYQEDTNILETVFRCRAYAFRVVDFFPRYKTILPSKKTKVLKKNRLVRLIEPIRGVPKLKAVFDPRFGYARKKTVLKISKDKIIAKNRETELHLETNLDCGQVLGGEYIDIKHRVFFVLAKKGRQHDLKKVMRLYSATRQYWHKWVRTLVLPENNRKLIIRSALVLKLLTYSETGAILAGVTTSIPEMLGTNRNFDYRFCWLRDAAFCADAFKKIGRDYEAKKLMGFVMKRCIEDDHLQPLYGIRGESWLVEKSLPHLGGFAGSRPVRVGNKAFDQVQNDIYGEMIDIIYLYFIYYQYEKMTRKHWNFLRFLVNQIRFSWYKKDSSIWEFRGLYRHYTFSKFMCYVGVDRAVKIAQHQGRDEAAKEWVTLRDEIMGDLLKKGFNRKLDTFTMAYRFRELDASLLLMAYHEVLPGTDPRLISTVRAIYNGLRQEDLVQRYSARDDFGKSTSAFTVCSFWLIDALYYIGEKDEAKRIWEKLTHRGNHLGLYSEDIDLKTGKLLGNFPQGYCHLALINSAILLSEWSAKRKRIDWGEVKRQKWL